MLDVYNPDDEPLLYGFAGVQGKSVPANKTTSLPDNEARFLQETFGKFGITIIPKDLSAKERKLVIEAADERYVTGTRQWGEEVLVEHHERTKTKRELGIVVDEPKEVKTAKAWMKANGFLK